MKSDLPVIRPRPNEAPDQMVKRFTRRVRDSGVLDEWRSRQSFVKPCARRRARRARNAYLRSR